MRGSSVGQSQRLEVKRLRLSSLAQEFPVLAAFVKGLSRAAVYDSFQPIVADDAAEQLVGKKQTPLNLFQLCLGKDRWRVLRSLIQGENGQCVYDMGAAII